MRRMRLSQVGREAARAAHAAESRARGGRQDTAQLALDFDVSVGAAESDWRIAEVEAFLGPWLGQPEADEQAGGDHLATEVQC